MKKNTIIYLSLVFIAICSFNRVRAQEDSADSLQRVIMKDSLSVSDSVISQVFSIRNNFLTQAAQISADSSLSDPQKNTARQSLITATNSAITLALGETVYEKYLQMIRRRMTIRPMMNGREPLASQGN